MQSRSVTLSKTQAQSSTPDAAPTYAPLADRKVVFISHANPEANAITAWYGARLTAMGYEVWTDLTRLLGGEEMWLDIDEVLRWNARKVIALLSRDAVTPSKDGVRAELDRAHIYRRKLGDRRFIVPILVDDVAYDQLPPTIGNRTVIRGTNNHAAALARVIQIFEEDNVPRNAAPASDALLRWQRVLAPSETMIEAERDSLISNWYELRSLPSKIHFYEINRPLSNALAEPAQLAKEHPLPCAHYLRRLVAFAPWDALQEPMVEHTPVKLEHTMDLETFLSGGDEKIRIDYKESGKLAVSLLRRAFDGMAKARGLLPYSLSERKSCWWMPDGVLPENRSEFVRESGLPGWRKLTGKYTLRNHVWSWHFGVNGVPIIGDTPRIRIAPHLIYTDPEGKLATTAEFRRSHAKLWFNAKWRDLMYAMMAYLADGKDHVSIPLGGDAMVALAASPMTLTLDVRPPASFEKKTTKASDDEGGDSADLDVSDYVGDPALSALVADDETNGSSTEAEEDVEQ
jgi:hypothetical protein